MNKFNLFTYMILLGTAFSANAMEQSNNNDQPTVHPVCQKIKTIEFNAPQKEYRNLAKELKQNNRTVCDCIKEILIASKFYAARAIDPNWQPDPKPFKTINCAVKCDGLSERRCKLMKKVFEENEVPKNKADIFAAIEVDYQLYYPRENTSIRWPIRWWTNNSNNDHQISMDAQVLLNPNSGVDRGTLAHEKVHLEQGYDFDFLKNVAFDSEEQRQKYNKFHRLLEKQADLFPIACSKYWKKNLRPGDFRYDMGKKFSFVDKTTEEKFGDCLSVKSRSVDQEQECKSLFSEINNYWKNSGWRYGTHPSDLRRFFWQKKLGRLMKEQEKIRK